MSPFPAAGKLTNPRSPRALLRSYSDTNPRSPRALLRSYSDTNPRSRRRSLRSNSDTDRRSSPAPWRSLIPTCLLALVALGFSATPALATTAPAGTGTQGACPNEHLRAEQPYGLALPDCRAYEMVSPRNTNGQDATKAGVASSARASEAPTGNEPAITYPSRASFSEPTGALVENQYVSRRTPTR